MNTLVLSPLLAAAAWVIVWPLMQQGMILHPYARLLGRLDNAGHGWLAKPLGWCGKCLSGQLALWHYLTTAAHYSLWDALFSITTTILIYIILEKWLQRFGA